MMLSSWGGEIGSVSPVHCWKNMVTHAKITRRNIGIDLNREATAMNWSLIVLHAEPSARRGNRSATERFSKSD